MTDIMKPIQPSGKKQHLPTVPVVEQVDYNDLSYIPNRLPEKEDIYDYQRFLVAHLMRHQEVLNMMWKHWNDTPELRVGEWAEVSQAQIRATVRVINAIVNLLEDRT